MNRAAHIVRRGSLGRAAHRLAGAIGVIALLALGVVASPTPPAAAANYLGSAHVEIFGVGRPTSIVAGADGNLWFANPAAGAFGSVTPGGTVTMLTPSAYAPIRAMAPGPAGNIWFAHGFGSIGVLGPDHRTNWWNVTGTVVDLTAGPDGRMWFTTAEDAVGVISANGAFHRYFGPQIDDPQGIVSGPGAALWYANRAGSSIGRVTFTGVVQTPFTDPAIDHPTQLALGADGNIWFVNGTTSSVGRITPAGVVTTFPYVGPAPVDIAPGPAGTLWLALDSPTGTAGLARVTTAGVVTLLDGAVGATAVTAGPDGNVWFVSPSTGRVGRSTPSGAVSTFRQPLVDGPAHVAMGADDDIWFTSPESHSVARLHAGAVTAFTDPALVGPDDLVRGPDGNLWFTDPAAGTVGRIAPDGTIAVFTAPGVDDPQRITTGPDGNLWFTNHGSDTIGRATPAGTITTFADATIHAPEGITAGPDGNLWFTNSMSDTVGRITPAGVVSSFGGAGIDDPGAIVGGPDGQLWFANGGDGIVRRMTIDGTVSPLGTYLAVVHAHDLTADPSGHVWYAGREGVGVFDPYLPDGGYYARHISDLVVSAPGVQGIAVGPQGDLWFAHPADDLVGYVGTDLPRTYTATATAGDGQITVHWDSPWGGDGPSDYVVTPSIGGVAQAPLHAPGSVNLLVINGVPNGTTYTFTVTAVNGRGRGLTSHPTAPVTPNLFTDVPVGAPFLDDIAWLVHHDIATGYADGTFRPTAPVSRQATAAFLHRFAGSPLGAEPTCGAAAFLDVPAGAPFCGEIHWLVDQGLATGYPDGTFHPTAAVSRQALAAFLYRSAGAPLGDHPPCDAAPFADVAVGAPFCGEITWLVDHGIAHGFPDGTFHPTADVSRQATAAFLHRLDAEVHP